MAQRIAGHADSRTTKLYDRHRQRVLLEGHGADSIPIESMHQENFRTELGISTQLR
jgi:hypothetical protein